MTTETETQTEVTISARSRNLGYGWRTDAEQTSGGLRVRSTTAPDVTGGLATVEREMASRHRVTSPGGYYTEALFVGSARVTHVWDGWVEDHPDYLAACELWEQSADNANTAYPEARDYPLGAYREGWMIAGGTVHTVRDLVRRLRDGESLRVQLESARA